jgi:8-hydroxy-5-deazaflavin:NADPH oxidoreductase
VGKVLGNAWIKRGHEVAFGVRDIKSEKSLFLAQEFPSACVLPNAEAARAAEIIVLATPWQTTREAVRACGDLDGKTLIDCSNPLKPDVSRIRLSY